jgi:hypothetical protein
MAKLFKNVEVNETFHRNGNTYRKVSMRTAQIILPENLAGKRFYFMLTEPVGGK